MYICNEDCTINGIEFKKGDMVINEFGKQYPEYFYEAGNKSSVEKTVEETNKNLK